MFGLPEETVVDLQIPANQIFLRAIQAPSLQKIYTEQVREIYWRNKLSEENYGLENAGFFRELEIFELKLHMKSLDKRLLGAIDRAMPYYIFHILSWDNYCQAMIANKRAYSGKIKVENYYKSGWMNVGQLQFVFEKRSLDQLYNSLKEQVREKRPRKFITAKQSEECCAFLNYCKTMRMSRSYKPVLIMAVLKHGGRITVAQAANDFLHYYHSRKKQGLSPEFGTCIYAEENATIKAVYANLIQNPIAALCRSGFFEYDKEENVLSFLPGIYDGLSLDEIDEVIRLCQQRLNQYFSKRDER